MKGLVQLLEEIQVTWFHISYWKIVSVEAVKTVVQR